MGGSKTRSEVGLQARSKLLDTQAFVAMFVGVESKLKLGQRNDRPNTAQIARGMATLKMTLEKSLKISLLSTYLPTCCGLFVISNF